MIEAIEAGNDKRCPTTQEDGGGHAGADDDIEIFGQVIITEIHTGILRMVAGRQLTFTLRQVEGATVTLCITGNEIDDKSRNRNNMSAEDIPTELRLLLADLRKAHRTRQANHGQHHDADRQLVRNDLRTGTHRTDKGKLIVRRPTGQKNADDTHTATGQEEEHAHIEINDLRALAPRQAGKGHHRSGHHEERRYAM